MAGQAPSNPPQAQGQTTGQTRRSPPQGEVAGEIPNTPPQGKTASEIPSSSPLSSPPESIASGGSPRQSEKVRSSSAERLSVSPTRRKRKPDDPSSSGARSREAKNSREEKQRIQEESVASKNDDGGSSNNNNNSEPTRRKRRRLVEVGTPVASTKSSAASGSKSSGMTATRKSAKDKKWEAPFVYTDERSPLARVDLRVRTYLIKTQSHKKCANIHHTHTHRLSYFSPKHGIFSRQKRSRR